MGLDTAGPNPSLQIRQENVPARMDSRNSLCFFCAPYRSDLLGEQTVRGIGRQGVHRAPHLTSQLAGMTAQDFLTRGLRRREPKIGQNHSYPAKRPNKPLRERASGVTGIVGFTMPVSYLWDSHVIALR